MTNVLLYAVTVLVWGSTWLAIKFQLGVVAPEVSLAYRFALAAAIMFCWVGTKGFRLRFGWRDHVCFALTGAFMFSTNFYVFYLAAFDLTTGLLAVIFSTVSIMNIANGALFLGRRVTPRVLVGALCGTMGIAVIFWPELAGFDLDGAGTRGLLLAVGGALCFSLGNMVSARNQARGLPVVSANAWGMAYGTLLLFVFALLSGAAFNFDPAFPYVASLLYLAVFGSVVAFAAYLTLLGRIGAERSAYATVLFPVIALGLSTFFESYLWTPGAVLGVGLVLLGNALALAPVRRRAGHVAGEGAA